MTVFSPFTQLIAQNALLGHKDPTFRRFHRKAESKRGTGCSVLMLPTFCDCLRPMTDANGVLVDHSLERNI